MKVGSFLKRAAVVAVGIVSVFVAGAATADDIESFVSYVESAKNAYVVLDRCATSNNVVEAKVQMLESGSNAGIFCSRGTNVLTNTFTLHYVKNSGFRFDYGQAAVKTYSTTKTDRSYLIRCSDTEVTVDGTKQFDVTPASFEASNPYMLFATYQKTQDDSAIDTSTIGNKAKIRLFSFKVTQDGVVVVDLYPCKTTSNVGALYDRISGKVYTSDDTADLTASATVVQGPGQLDICGSPDDVSAVSPDYGAVCFAPGGTMNVSAPAVWTNDNATAAARCIGWTLYDETDSAVGSGAGTSFQYIHPNPAAYRKLAWNWRREYPVTASAAANGTASPAAQWGELGLTVTVTATPDVGYRFSYWSGNVTDVPILENPAKVPADRARALVAHFVAEDTVVTTNRYTGAKDGLWNVAGNWSLGHVPTAEENAEIPNTKGTVTISNAAACASLKVGTDTHLTLKGFADVSDGQPRFDIRGDVTWKGKNLTLGTGTATSMQPLFYAGGDMTMDFTGWHTVITVYAGDPWGTNTDAVIKESYMGTPVPRAVDYHRGGAQVIVRGRLSLPGTRTDRNHTINVCSHKKTGLSPVFRIGSLDLGPRATVTGYQTGWISCNNGYHGRGGPHADGGGASYGGRGGSTSSTNPAKAGDTYGSPYAPWWAGSASGRGGTDGGHGGSVFRLHATGDVEVAGTISMNGRDWWSNTVRSGGSGGGIWITCQAFTATETTVLSAVGGGHSVENGAAGGGGRICVTTGGPTESDIRSFLETGTCAGYSAIDFSLSPWPTIVNVAGGKNSYSETWYPGTKPYLDGSAGTAFYLQKVPAGQTVFTVTATPYRLGNADPALLTHIVDEGDHLCSNDEYVYLEGSGERTRMHLTGCVWTNELTHGSSTASPVTVPVKGETTLVWQYGDLEQKLDATSGGHGTVSSPGMWIDDGTEATVTAVPADGATFVRWVGDISATDATKASVSLTMDRPRRLIAIFDMPSAAARAFTYAGAGDWFDPATWDGTAIPGTNDTVTISATAQFSLSDVIRVGTLVVGAGTLSFDCTNEKDARLEVAGDLTVADGAAIVWGRLSRTSRADIAVGGDFTLNGTAKLEIFAGEGVDVATSDWRAFKRGGSSVAVGGDLALNGTSSIVPHSAKASGLPVVMSVGRDVTIAEGAAIIAAKYVGTQNGDRYYESYGWCFTNGLGVTLDRGGSHGGLGGSVSDASKVYGFKYAPFYPGSPGNKTNNGWGGGAIRLDAKGTVTLNGQIVATGGYHSGFGNACGAGGSVWITCGEFSYGAAARIEARGGRSLSSTGCPAGGGGRIAIMTGSPSDAQIDSLYESGTCDYLLVIAEDMTDSSCAYASLASVKGGICNDQEAAPTHSAHGKPGTAVMLKNSYGQATITVQGSVQTLLTDPQYGSTSVDLGEQTFTAPAFVYSDDNLSRHPCTGYEWSDTNGRSGSGSALSVTIDIQTDTTVTWLWGAQEHFLDVRCAGFGTLSYAAQGDNEPGWYDVGTVVDVVCTPEDAQTTFKAWLGDVADAVKGNASVSVTVDRPKIIVATLYRDAARARDLAWTGAAGDGDWFNRDNWDGAAAPGPSDRVTLASGKAQVKYPCALTLASLTLSGDAKLFVGCRTSTTYYGGTWRNTYYSTVLDDTDARDSSLTVDGDFTVGGTAQAYFGGVEQKGRMDLTVNGDFTMDGSSSVSQAWVQVYAGRRGEWTELDNYVTGGGSLKVGGALTLTGHSRLTPCCDRYSGAVVPISARTVLVNTNALIEADMRGFGRSYANPGTGWTMTLYGYCTTGSMESFGGTYGGQGGFNHTASFGYLAAPFHPGGTGATPATYTDKILSGGGAIRIATSRLELYGKITSNTHGQYRVGAGAGGGIWITTRRFVLGDQRVEPADRRGSVEAYHTDGSDYSTTGGGGGGRISICLKLSPAQIAKMYRSGEVRGMVVTNLADLPEWSGHYNVNGGKGPSDGKDGTAGTAVLVTAPPDGFTLIVR